MCGIYGIVKFNGSSVESKVLKYILKELTLESKIRGRDATGYAFMGKNGATIYKHNVHSDNFVSLSNYKKVINENISNNEDGCPYSIIGHTRRKTLGTPSNPNNNHPIVVESIIGVHNGYITNHDAIFDEINKHCNNKNTRIAEVDSEAIFALINYYSKESKHPSICTNKDLIGNISNPTSTAIMKAAKKLEGSFTCALLDADNPARLWVFKAKGVLTINYYRKEKLLIFASIDQFIENAVSACNFSDPDTLLMPDFSGLCFDAVRGTYNSFALDRTNYTMVY